MKTIGKFPPQKLRDFMRFWSINGGHIMFSFNYPREEFKPTGLPLPEPQQKITQWHNLTLQNFEHPPFKTSKEMGVTNNEPRGKDLHVQVTGQAGIRKAKPKPAGVLSQESLESMLSASMDGRRVRMEFDWDARETNDFVKTIWESDEEEEN